MKPETRQAVIRAVRFPAILTAIYLVLRLAFAALSEDDGLISPSGLPNLGVATLGFAVLVLRLVVILVLPPLIAYRAVLLAAERSR